jgi:hypothetical protein
MLTSFVNTSSEILKIFANSGNIVVPCTETGAVTIPTRYARESAKTKTQKKSEEYPQLVVYDHFPKYDTDWNPNFQKYIDDYHDFTGTNGAPVKAYVFSEPLRFLLQYDITIYVNNPLHRWAVADYMEKYFSKMGSFCLNKITLPDGDLGDFVSYTVEMDENERKDGIHELFYQFTLKPMINLTDPQEVNLITNFTLNINPTSI